MKGGTKYHSNESGWFKVWVQKYSWSWNMKGEGGGANGLDMYARFDSAGVYTIKISGRSYGHAIDRLVLYDESRYSQAQATSLSHDETRCYEGYSGISVNEFRIGRDFVFRDDLPVPVEVTAKVYDMEPGRIDSVFLDLTSLGGDRNTMMEPSGENKYTAYYTIPAQEPGSKLITLTAFDNDGNKESKDITFTIRDENRPEVLIREFSMNPQYLFREDLPGELHFLARTTLEAREIVKGVSLDLSAFGGDEHTPMMHSGDYYQYVVDIPNQPAGNKKIICTVTDNAGNSQSDTITFYVGDKITAINCGGQEYTSSNGITYLPDQFYSGGSVSSTADPIENTSDDVLYQSNRSGNISYQIPLPNEAYQVTLHFAETVHELAGKRVFDVNVEYRDVIADLDLVQDAGHDGAYAMSFPFITVFDNVLNIELKGDTDKPLLSALVITHESAVGMQPVQDNPLRIYPNPAKDRLNISSSVPVNKVEIMDVTGRVHENFRENDIQFIPVSELPSGYYLLKLHLADNSRVIKSFTKD